MDSLKQTLNAPRTLRPCGLPAGMMPSRLRQHAPLYSAGIPGWMTDALRLAGVQVEALTLDSGSGWTDRNRRPTVLILYDSRDAVSRNAIGDHGDANTLLDMAPLAHQYGPDLRSSSDTAHPREGPSSVRLSFLEELKQRIESSGFCWTRVADCPYPFQSLQLDEEGNGGHGTAFQSAGAALCGSSEESSQSLLWRPTLREFAQWTRIRRGVCFTLHSANDTLSIVARIPESDLRPALEVWRGRHHACLPLKAGTSRIDRRTLVFQLTEPRPPGGLLVGWAEFAQVAPICEQEKADVA